MKKIQENERMKTDDVAEREQCCWSRTLALVRRDWLWVAAWTIHLRLWVEGRKGGQMLVGGGWQRHNTGGLLRERKVRTSLWRLESGRMREVQHDLGRTNCLLRFTVRDWSEAHPCDL